MNLDGLIAKDRVIKACALLVKLVHVLIDHVQFNLVGEALL